MDQTAPHRDEPHDYENESSSANTVEESLEPYNAMTGHEEDDTGDQCSVESATIGKAVRFNPKIKATQAAVASVSSFMRANSSTPSDVKAAVTKPGQRLLLPPSPPFFRWAAGGPIGRPSKKKKKPVA
jgi:hypothetical protein